VITLGAVLAAACSSMFRQPEVRLESVSLSGIGLRGASLLARLNIDNPNGFDLESRSMTYQLDLQDPDSAEHWVRLAQYTLEQKISVDAHSAGCQPRRRLRLGSREQVQGMGMALEGHEQAAVLRVLFHHLEPQDLGVERPRLLEIGHPQ
jgi:hypothetical protein